MLLQTLCSRSQPKERDREAATFLAFAMCDSHRLEKSANGALLLGDGP